jgi:hypothetical protein
MDMPYEQIVLERVNDTIYSLVGSAISGWVEETAESYVMAEYSTEEKAIKAMNMLRDAYIYLKQCEIKNDYVQMPPACFQFPQDDKVEV